MNFPFDNMELLKNMAGIDLLVGEQNFDWKTYIKINSDLKDDPDINSKETAWKHWIFHGYQEERPVSAINNTNVHNGRFGNLFFINMVMHFVAIKLNLKCRYKYFKKFERLGIYLYVGENNYDSTETVTDENFLNLKGALRETFTYKDEKNIDGDPEVKAPSTTG
jgi:hypothetical protein